MMRKFVEGKSRSKEYDRAVRALRELAEWEGAEQAGRAFSEAVSDMRQEGLREKGYRKSPASPCIRKLLGYRCDMTQCHPPGSDHSSLWYKKGKPALFLSQPYQLGWEEMRKLVAFCLQHKLRADVSSWPSHYFPSQVISLHLTKAEDFGKD